MLQLYLHSTKVLKSTVVLSRCRATMHHQEAVLKLLLCSERATGVLAIENHHTYRSYTLLEPDNRVTAALPRVTSR